MEKETERRTTVGSWEVPVSRMSERTVNPIRRIVDAAGASERPADKTCIPLSIGDPTVFGNLAPAAFAVEAVRKALDSGEFFGYPPSVGHLQARKAVADFFNLQNEGGKARPLSPDDVILASGCSHALEMAITAICDEGDEILVPVPGFTLYTTICKSFGIKPVGYDLLPRQNWEVDLDQAHHSISAKTKAILVNNPSNPVGSNFSKSHIQSILQFAERHRIPVIADEVYWNIVFTGEKFHSFASLSDSVPVISVGGLAKMLLVPGWRLGWCLLHDPRDMLKGVKAGIVSLSQKIVGPNSLIQGALPEILKHCDEAYFEDLNGRLEENAKYSMDRVSQMPGLRVLPCKASMYFMVEILTNQFKDISSDLDFMKRLAEEENVMVLPGEAFGLLNYFRVVFCAPVDKLKIAFDRMEDFCKRHLVERQ